MNGADKAIISGMKMFKEKYQSPDKQKSEDESQAKDD